MFPFVQNKRLDDLMNTGGYMNPGIMMDDPSTGGLSGGLVDPSTGIPSSMPPDPFGRGQPDIDPNTGIPSINAPNPLSALRFQSVGDANNPMAMLSDQLKPLSDSADATGQSLDKLGYAPAGAPSGTPAADNTNTPTGEDAGPADDSSMPSAGGPATSGQLGNVIQSVPDLSQAAGATKDPYATPLLDRLTQSLLSMPERLTPTRKQQILGALAGFAGGLHPAGMVDGRAVGIGYDPNAAATARDRILYGDYNKQMADYEARTGLLEKGAGIEEKVVGAKRAMDFKYDNLQRQYDSAQLRSDTLLAIADQRAKSAENALQERGREADARVQLGEARNSLMQEQMLLRDEFNKLQLARQQEQTDANVKKINDDHEIALKRMQANLDESAARVKNLESQINARNGNITEDVAEHNAFWNRFMPGGTGRWEATGKQKIKKPITPTTPTTPTPQPNTQTSSAPRVPQQPQTPQNKPPDVGDQGIASNVAAPLEGTKFKLPVPKGAKPGGKWITLPSGTKVYQAPSS